LCMQNTAQGAGSSNQSKLGAISNLGALLQTVERDMSTVDGAVSKLQGVISRLNSAAKEIKDRADYEQKQKENQEKYGDLIKKREQERLEAERKVDERTEKKLAETKAKEEAKKAEAPKPIFHQPQAPIAPEKPLSYQRPIPGYTGANNQRTFAPRQDGARPSYGGGQYNNSHNNYAQRGGAGGNAPQNGQRPFQPNGNYAPRPYGQNTFGQGGVPRPFPPRDPNRPFVPRTGGVGGAPRPFGQRPTGARPAGALGVAKPTEKFVPKVDTYSAKKKVKTFDSAEKQNTMDKRAMLRRGMLEEQEIEGRMLTRVFRTKKQREGGAKTKVTSSSIVINTNPVPIKVLSEKIGKAATEIIKQLMVLGNMCTINSSIDFDLAQLVAMEFGVELTLDAAKTSEEKMAAVHSADKGDEGKMEPKPPVVTIMGHVDHGKTSLLDTIRKTNVAGKEHGGITQHIGAYMVNHGGKKITFIDTPGHAAFEKMRARGAKITDIAILLVAGDDGVMEQTVEAIKHIQKNKLPMIVAVNKMDKPGANVEKVKEQLATHNVLTEEWGGDAILVPVSAVTGKGIDKLLEMILLVSEMNAYRANPNKEAQGAIIDAHSDPKIGALVTVLVQSGTLHVGDTILAGVTSGKVKRMQDENGKTVKAATPGMPVQVLGFNEVPKAGDACHVVDDKLTREVVSERKEKERVTKTSAGSKKASEIDAVAKLNDAAKKQLNLIIKGDVSGSVEAIIQSINNITSDEVKINVISSGVGVVNDNDVNLSQVANAVLIAFNVKTSPTAVKLAKEQKVEIHGFNVIYRIFDFVTEQMVRRFTPKFNEIYYGKAEVLAIFKSSALGQIAGCMVKDGKVLRGAKVRLFRGKVKVGEYTIDSLKIKKDDQKEVAGGFECGIKLDSDVEVLVGDMIECFGLEQQPIIYGGKKYEF